MSFYFDDPVAVVQLRQAVAKWLGTPFVAHAAIRGGGVDCVHLVAQLYMELGVIQKFDPPKYSLQEGKHVAVSKVIIWLEESGRFTRNIVSPIRAGDLLCMRFKQRVIHHVGLAIDEGNFVHVLERRTVAIANISNYRHSTRAVYRPLAIS